MLCDLCVDFGAINGLFVCLCNFFPHFLRVLNVFLSL